MSIALIAVTVVLLLGHLLPALAAWRRPQATWQVWQRLGLRLGLRRFDGVAGVLWLLLPCALLGLLQGWLGAQFWGVLLLPYGIVVLFLCWGPRDLDHDVTTLGNAEDAATRSAARERLGIAASDEHPAAAVAGVFRAGLDRWFAPLFWFIALGGAGAVLYRLSREAVGGGVASTSPLARLRWLLEWPVAQLLTLGLAVVGNFDAVALAWRRWHQAQTSAWFGRDAGFLDAAAQASVACEQIEAAEDADDLDPAGQVPADALRPSPQQAALHDALSLLRRVLLAWMAVLAIAVLGGLAG